MRWFRRWYGANPLHLLVMLGCIALYGYAAGRAAAGQASSASSSGSPARSSATT